MSVRVMKFGGTSVGRLPALRSAFDAVERAAREVKTVVVVSAMAGVTNELDRIAAAAARGDLDTAATLETLERLHLEHLSAVASGAPERDARERIEALLARLGDLLSGLTLLRELPGASRDLILSMGERMLAPIFQAGLESRGHGAALADAADLIRTDSYFGEARVDRETTAALVRAAVAAAGPKTLVVPGFYGADVRGATTLLGRGASDYSASLVGAAVQAERVEIWSDVDGVLAADPRLVASAETVPVLSFAEAAELSFYGAKILHPMAVAPAIDAGVPLVIRNTLRPEHAGTRIQKASAGTASLARAVATCRPVTLLSIDADVDETASERLGRLLAAIARVRAPVLLLVQSSSPPRISLAVESSRVERLLDSLAGDLAGERIRERVVLEGDLGLVAAVGELSSAAGAARTDAFVGALESAGIEQRLVTAGTSPLSVAALVPAAELPRAAEAVHRALVAEAPPVPISARAAASGRRTVRLVLVGASGQVARSLSAQLAASQERLARSAGIELRVVGALNRRRMIWNEDGLPAQRLSERLDNGSETVAWSKVLERAASRAACTPTLLVDCTASADITGRYPQLLSAGIGVVTPNKLAAAAPLEFYRRVHAAAREGGAPFRYETTVGAALPVLRAARELALRGDPVRAVAGVLSGTLSYVFHRLHDGLPFSRAVAEAHAKGMTEPHPREDLSGEDVARKLLILLRELGRPLERSEITVERLVPPELAREDDPKRFLAAFGALDDSWALRVAEARRREERWVYAARFDADSEGGRASVGAVSLPLSSPLAAARAGENVIALWTDHYDEVPLTISGLGAGPRVTAAGVLSDILEAVHAFR